MRLEDFARTRQARWQELQAATKQTSSGRFKRMSVSDLERIDKLYRSTASDLAIATRDFPDDNVTVYLNGVCARAHAVLNRGEPPRLADIPNFFRRTLPRTFRRNVQFFWLSIGISLVATAAGWIAVYARPDLHDILVPQSLFDQLAQGKHPSVPPSSFLSSLVITNNIKVDLVAFAGGVLLGSMTTFVLITNGWMLGTFGAAVHQGHYDGLLWSYIVPHGAIELSVIMLAGAAGLMLGNAELRPGLLSRGQALNNAAKDAVVLALGVAALLCVAGFFEGFVSPSNLPVSVKYVIGAVNFTWLYLWLFRCGREPEQRPVVSLDAVSL